MDRLSARCDAACWAAAAWFSASPAIKALSLLLLVVARAFAVRDLIAAKVWLAEGLDPEGAAVDA